MTGIVQLRGVASSAVAAKAATMTVGTHHSAALIQSIGVQTFVWLNSVRNAPFQFFEPYRGMAVGRRAPIAARRQRTAGGDLGSVGQGRAFELASLEEAIEEHIHPAFDLGQVQGAPCRSEGV